MNSKASLAIILIAMLLADSMNGLKWQGTGSGMNSTVLSEIWDGLGGNLNAALTTNNQTGYNAFTQQISDRLNNRWEQAWNVVLVKTLAHYDTILFGYAFRNQWMWFNGVSNSVLGASSVASLIVWKDFNCQTWGFLENEASAFTGDQLDFINSAMRETTVADFTNDIWGVAFRMMGKIEANPWFSQGGYSTIVSQDPMTDMYGRICKIVGQSYYKTYMTTSSIQLPNGDWQAVNYGSSYIFQTR